MTGIDLIAAERERQTAKEGWTPEHDDTHDGGEIAEAAACYALPEPDRDYEQRYYKRDATFSHSRNLSVPLGWPWDDEDWKPTPDDRVRELVKAGALIAAEIDRLQRASS